MESLPTIATSYPWFFRNGGTEIHLSLTYPYWKLYRGDYVMLDLPLELAESPERPFGTYTPMSDLLTEMVWSAVKELFVRDHTVRLEARRWLLSADDGLMSFLWIAEQLDLSPQLIRRIRNVALTRRGARRYFRIAKSSSRKLKIVG